MPKLPQPNAQSLVKLDRLNKITAKTGKQLPQIPIETIREAKNGYSCDEAGDVTGLNLFDAKIADISFLTDFPRLTLLRLANNKITDISPIRALTQLNHIDLGRNQISDISPIRALTQLNVLSLAVNQITDLSPLQALTQLNLLDLQSNQIAALSPLQVLTQLNVLLLSNNQISDLSPLMALTQLNVLLLSNNQIADLSPLQALTQLKELNLESNQIADLSPLKALIQLTVLGLGGNQIADLSLLQALTQLTKLYLWNNQIADLSPLKALTQLNKLFLNHNQISDLSPIRALIQKMEINWELTSGDGIFLKDNPLEIPPPEIVKQGSEAVAAYFASLETEENLPLNEVKVLLVGDGAAGKTSLVKRLMDKGFDIKEPQTQGINIDDWSVKQGKKSINVHLWDFGGQEIMHATHQFFLSKRSLYVLVLDGRRDEKTEYWLKHIESFGGDSPALVVLNKIDTQPGFEVNRKFLQEKYQNIKGFFRLSCHTGEGIPAFKEALQQALFKIEMTNITWPASWFKVKTYLEEMDEPFISVKRCDEICAKYKINKKASRDTLVDFLNDLGVILHFKDFELEGTHVLSPRWATEAVYKIINSKELAEQSGTLRLSLLGKILKQKKKDDYVYPPDKYRYIIELMMKFEICYRLDGDRVLIPDLLAVEESEFTFDYDNALRFIIEYDFLPRSVLPRFMVRRHKDIKEGLQWRTGVVLQEQAFHAEALVKADEEKRRIYIYVTGRQKRDYFSIIRKTIRDINDSFEKLKTTELVPLPDHPDITVEYEELTGHERAKRTEIFIGKLEKGYPVALLLDGIEKPDDRIKHDYDKDPGKIYPTPSPPTERDLLLKKKADRKKRFWKIVFRTAIILGILAAIATIINSIL